MDISRIKKLWCSREKTASFQNETATFQNETATFQNETTPFQNETTLPDINTDNNLTVSNDTVCRTDVQRVAGQWNLLDTYRVKPKLYPFQT